MAPHSTHLRSNLYDLPVGMRTSRPIAELIGLTSSPPPPSHPLQTAPIQVQQGIRPKAIKGRAKIWELNSNLHCSVIGTCLSAGELRRLLVRLKVPGIDLADEHELHMLGVLLADRPNEGGKLLQKTLDRRHQVALNQFAKAKDDAAIAVLWDKAMTGGDIPGAFWAVLTHQNSSDKLVQKAFGDVHMMSHLMGATNCADLRRMRQLEDENAALVAKLERQQKQLRDGFVERDGKINRLTRSLAEKIELETDRPQDEGTGEVAMLKSTIADLSRRLSHETSRRERLEQRQDAFEQAENLRRRAEQELGALRSELDIIESQIGSALPSAASAPAVTLDLAGSTVLYVGGRASQIPQLKALIEQGGGHFIHHDGGVEHAAALLAGLVGRADITVFPVDCVSHNAMSSAKRICGQFDKPFLALRTSSLACLLSSLTPLYRPAPQTGA